jgi:ketosteroid isomerase-like protein
VTTTETVEAIYEAFGRGDVDGVLAHMAEDVEWDCDAPGYGIPFYEPGTGKAHVRRFFAALAEEVEITRFAPGAPLTGGDQVAVTVDFAGTVRATGRPVEALEVHLWTFGRDGLVSRFFHCVDRHAFVLAYAR